MIDFLKLDPATMQASVELDAWIADKWMGRLQAGCWDGWSPSTCVTHAGEARRKAGLLADLRHDIVTGYAHCVLDSRHVGHCAYDETNGDKAAAEALATVRAIVAALQAAEKASEKKR